MVHNKKRRRQKYFVKNGPKPQHQMCVLFVLWIIITVMNIKGRDIVPWMENRATRYFQYLLMGWAAIIDSFSHINNTQEEPSALAQVCS